MQPDPAPLETPPANPVATLEEAVNRMVAIDAELALDDGLRYFNLLYLEVTREAVRWVGGGQLAVRTEHVVRLELVEPRDRRPRKGRCDRRRAGLP